MFTRFWVEHYFDVECEKSVYIKNTEGNQGKRLQFHLRMHLYKYKHTCICRVTVFDKNMEYSVILLLRVDNVKIEDFQVFKFLIFKHN